MPSSVFNMHIVFESPVSQDLQHIFSKVCFLVSFQNKSLKLRSACMDFHFLQEDKNIPISKFIFSQFQYPRPHKHIPLGDTSPLWKMYQKMCTN